MIEEEDDNNQVLASVEDLVPHTMNAVLEDPMLKKMVCTIRNLVDWIQRKDA